jgi:hypothetical protein
MGAKPGLSQVREEYAEGVREEGVEEGIFRTKREAVTGEARQLYDE